MAVDLVPTCEPTGGRSQKTTTPCGPRTKTAAEAVPRFKMWRPGTGSHLEDNAGEHLAQARQAVGQVRELMASGRLASYYQAAIGEGGPVSQSDALALFEKLPSLMPNTTADHLIRLGLWSQAPRGLAELAVSPRYFPGRQVLVMASVGVDPLGSDFLAYRSANDGGAMARTHRATLVRQDGTEFLVRVDGRDELLRVPLSQIAELNQPHDHNGASYHTLGQGTEFDTTIDYNSPLMRAKLVEVALLLSPLAAALDFRPSLTFLRRAKRGFLDRWFDPTKKLEKIQKRCITTISDAMQTDYSRSAESRSVEILIALKEAIHRLFGSETSVTQGKRYGGDDAGRLAINGEGNCFKQSGILLALLAPFGSALGIDGQIFSGASLSSGEMLNPLSPGRRRHMFLQLTCRPAMTMLVMDRTWRQLTTVDRAYSRFGLRYPFQTEGPAISRPLVATDLAASRTVWMEPRSRDFGKAGRDGRDAHM